MSVSREESPPQAILMGRVRDSLSRAVSGVYVLLGGTRQHTLTTADGSFRLVTTPGTYDVVFSYQEGTNVLHELTLPENDTPTPVDWPATPTKLLNHRLP